MNLILCPFDVNLAVTNHSEIGSHYIPLAGCQLRFSQSVVEFSLFQFL